MDNFSISAHSSLAKLTKKYETHCLPPRREMKRRIAPLSRHSDHMWPLLRSLSQSEACISSADQSEDSKIACTSHKRKHLDNLQLAKMKPTTRLNISCMTWTWTACIVCTLVCTFLFLLFSLFNSIHEMKILFHVPAPLTAHKSHHFSLDIIMTIIIITLLSMSRAWVTNYCHKSPANYLITNINTSDNTEQ